MDSIGRTIGFPELSEQQLLLLSFEQLLLHTEATSTSPEEAAASAGTPPVEGADGSDPTARPDQLAATLAADVSGQLIDTNNAPGVPLLLRAPWHDGVPAGDEPGGSLDLRLVDAAREWLDAAADRAAERWRQLNGDAEEPHPQSPRGRTRPRRAAPRADWCALPAAVEEARVQLGVTRDQAAQLAQLLVLAQLASPAPSASRRGSTPRAPLLPAIQPYVPYRLVLLQLTRPEHFASRAQFRAFSERQLAAFVGGLVCAVRRAPPGATWAMPTARARLDAGGVEATLLHIAHERLLPVYVAHASATTATTTAAVDEAALIEALRELTSAACAVYDGLHDAAPQSSRHVAHHLPFTYPLSLELYRPLVGCCFGGVTDRPATSTGLLRALRGVRDDLGVSDHLHLLCMLEWSFRHVPPPLSCGVADPTFLIWQVLFELTRVVCTAEGRAHRSYAVFSQSAPHSPYHGA